MPLPSSRQLANSLGLVTLTKPGATLEGAVRVILSVKSGDEHSRRLYWDERSQRFNLYAH